MLIWNSHLTKKANIKNGKENEMAVGWKKRGFGEDGQQNFLTDQLLDFGESGRTHDADQTTSAAKQ